MKMLMSTAKRCMLKFKWKGSIRNLSSISCNPSTYPTNVSCLETHLRVATEETGSLLSTIGMFCEAGPFNEIPDRNGFTHFLEHVAYKSFNGILATDFENNIALSGLSFKTFTARDHIAFYTTCCNTQVDFVLNALADILFECELRYEDITQAKRQLTQQLQDQDQNYKRMVFDLLHQTAYQGTRMAQTIQGPTRNISKFDRNNMLSFICETFQPWRMALVSSGGLSHEEFLYSVKNSRFGKFVGNPCVRHLPEQRRFSGSEVRFRNDDLPLAHIAIAVEAPSFCSPDFIPMLIASSIVGNWDRSQGGGINNASYVAQAISSTNSAERFESFYFPYKNTGLWGFYFVGDGMKIDDAMAYLQSEWMRISISVTSSDMERAINITKTNIAKMLANQESSCKDLGKQVLYMSRRRTLNDYLKAFAGIKLHDMQRVYDYIYDRCPAVAAVGPTEALPDYSRIRASMYWLRV